ncbi:MAG: iron ABC transporter permease [Anaerolineales bacterium]|uniref:ABC transporter permease n=1 Tax=Promineifilum sp. TaxID=2664178 RepID=UPI001D59431E|nr:iron ABC transporter permease [Anaerolineales bacterium]MCO5180258.1 iron ABC transporter permease [Promineifilum sp.]
MSIFELVNGGIWGAHKARDRSISIGRRRWSISHTFLLYMVACIVISLILLVPGYLLLRAAEAGAATVDTLLSARTWVTLGNTLLLTGAVVVSSAAISLPLAWLVTSSDLPGRRVWGILVALPLVVPSYVAAYLYVSLLSPVGVVQQLLEPLTGIERLPPIYGFPGAWLVLTLITYPFTYLTIRSAMKRLDPSLLEAARSLGQSPARAFWRITLPMLRPSLVAGSLLVALYCLRDFGAVTLLQYGTFTRVIYNRYQAYRLDEAAAMALLLVALTGVFLFLDHRSRGRSRYARLSAGAARVSSPTRLGMWKWPALLFVGLIVLLALVLPAGGLAYWLWRGVNQDWMVRDLAQTSQNVTPFLDLVRPAWNSVTVALGAAVLTIVLALPVTILAVRKPSFLSHWLERLAYAGAALPGIVVALAFVFMGVNYARPLYQTLPMLLIAYVVLFLPQAVGAERSSLLQVSPKLEEAGRSLGQRPFHVFRRVTLPLVRPGLVAAGAMVFLTAMKELPTTLILSPIGFNTLAVQVWANISEAFFARAAAPTLLLILLSSVPLAVFMLRDDS